MKAMLKYSLQTGQNILHIPGGLNNNARVDHQPGQQASLQLWTLVDDTLPIVEECVYVAVTGEPLPVGHSYYNLGTVLLHGGAFVLHALHVTKD